MVCIFVKINKKLTKYISIRIYSGWLLFLPDVPKKSYLIKLIFLIFGNDIGM